jgi:hypothetical protein
VQAAFNFERREYKRSPESAVRHALPAWFDSTACTPILAPVRPRTEYLGPDAGPVDNLFKTEEAEVEENKQETAPVDNERSQLETGWSTVLERPAKPLVRAVGSSVEGNAFSDQPEPPY